MISNKKGKGNQEEHDCENCPAKDVCDMLNELGGRKDIHEMMKDNVRVEVVKVDQEAVKFFNMGLQFATEFICESLSEGIKDKMCSFENFEDFEKSIYNYTTNKNMRQVADAITYLKTKGEK